MPKRLRSPSMGVEEHSVYKKIRLSNTTGSGTQHPSAFKKPAATDYSQLNFKKKPGTAIYESNEANVPVEARTATNLFSQGTKHETSVTGPSKRERSPSEDGEVDERSTKKTRHSQFSQPRDTIKSRGSNSTTSSSNRNQPSSPTTPLGNKFSTPYALNRKRGSSVFDDGPPAAKKVRIEGNGQAASNLILKKALQSPRVKKVSTDKAPFHMTWGSTQWVASPPPGSQPSLSTQKPRRSSNHHNDDQLTTNEKGSSTASPNTSIATSLSHIISSPGTTVDAPLPSSITKECSKVTSATIHRTTIESSNKKKSSTNKECHNSSKEKKGTEEPSSAKHSASASSHTNKARVTKRKRATEYKPIFDDDDDDEEEVLDFARLSAPVRTQTDVSREISSGKISSSSSSTTMNSALARNKSSLEPKSSSRPVSTATKGSSGNLKLRGSSTDISPPTIPASIDLKKASARVASNMTRRVKGLEDSPHLHYLGTSVLMAKDDIVTRSFTEAEKKKRGLWARKEEDDFDGPWKIEGFHHEVRKSLTRIEKLKLKLDQQDTKDDGESEDDLESELAAEIDILMTRKASLSFPKDLSKAPLSVAIGLLSPTFTEIPVRAELIPRDSAVANMSRYKKLVLALGQSQKNSQTNKISADNGESTPPSAAHKGNSAQEETQIYLARLKPDKFVALVEVNPFADEAETIEWEVESLRGKSVCLYEEDSEYVQKHQLVTDKEDPWVKELIMKERDLCRKKIVVVKYLVHWTGWPYENDTWELADGLPAQDIAEYAQVLATAGSVKDISKMILKEKMDVLMEEDEWTA